MADRYQGKTTDAIVRDLAQRIEELETTNETLQQKVDFLAEELGFDAAGFEAKRKGQSILDDLKTL